MWRLSVHSPLFVMRCTNWYHSYNFKNVKKNHGGVLLLGKMQAQACNFAKSNTSPWVFFTLSQSVSQSASQPASHAVSKFKSRTI